MDIRELARANKLLADTQNCKRVDVRAFLATFNPKMPEEEVREMLDAVECNCGRCR